MKNFKFLLSILSVPLLQAAAGPAATTQDYAQAVAAAGTLAESIASVNSPNLHIRNESGNTIDLTVYSNDFLCDSRLRGAVEGVAQGGAGAINLAKTGINCVMGSSEKEEKLLLQPRKSHYISNRTLITKITAKLPEGWAYGWLGEYPTTEIDLKAAIEKANVNAATEEEKIEEDRNINIILTMDAQNKIEYTIEKGKHLAETAANVMGWVKSWF